MQKLRIKIVLWLARIINPSVRPNREFKLDLEKLRQLPDETLGREVARFLDEHEFTPLDSGDLIQRTHDVWHVLTGLDADEGDEFRLQAFTRAQVFRPFSAILVLYGLLTGKLHPKDVMLSLKRGQVSHRLIDWDIESDWATPLAEVRRKLGIVPFRRKQQH
ncbi:MAG: hypothetical protein F6K19_14860 [Cyanothece sp. SIO1E1]|nr:hypothetical protein [Cyanothece sp. SIO1E1]